MKKGQDGVLYVYIRVQGKNAETGKDFTENVNISSGPARAIEQILDIKTIFLSQFPVDNLEITMNDVCVFRVQF